VAGEVVVVAANKFYQPEPIQHWFWLIRNYLMFVIFGRILL
jgi:hypothetical protein